MDLTSASTERGALSCLFRSRDAWLSVADNLSEEDFGFPLHKQLYHAVCICHEQKLAVDPVVLADRLGEHAQKELENVGGWAYLRDLLDTPISPVNIGELAKQLRELTLRRKTEVAGAQIQKLASTERNVDQMLGKAQVALDQVSAGSDEGVIKIGSDLAWNLQQKIEAANVVPGLPSGFDKLDMYLQGFQPGELYVLGARKKCHAAGTPILMFDGTIKPVEQVQFGDLLMGPESRPRKIMQLIQGTGAMREIIPSKGQPFRVNLDHLLTLQHQQTGEVIDISVRDWQLCTPKFQTNFRLIGTGVNFEPSKDPLTVDPYWLGVLLGDGHLAWGQQVTTHDEEIVEYGKEYADQLGLKFAQHDDTICLSMNSGAKNPLREWLKELGLLPIRCEDRFVPHRYKVASRENRLAILAGLIDTDGSLATGAISGALAYDYISKSSRLANDVAFLARSLGLWADVSPCLKRCGSGPHDRYFRVYISGDLASVPVRIARKKAVPTTEGKAVLRRSFKVMAVPNSAFYGFVLDGDQRYLMGDFTITHNCGKSVTLLTMARNLALRKQTPILYISTEHHHKLDQLRLLSMESEVAFNLLNSGMVKNQPGQMQRVTEAVSRIEDAPFHFKYLPSFDLGKVRRMARKYVRLEGVQAIFFDLIKMPQGQAQAKEWQELGNFAYGLKELAGEESVPLISAVQFNREGASAQRMQEDLGSDYFAGSDRIAQALTVAFALRRPYKDELADLGFTEDGCRILQVTDNRLGPSGYKGVLQFESSTLNLRELQRLA